MTNQSHLINTNQTELYKLHTSLHGAAISLCGKLKKPGWNSVPSGLFYFRPFLACYTTAQTPFPSNTGLSSSFQLHELLHCASPKISLWVCYTANCPFPTILEDITPGQRKVTVSLASVQQRTPYPSMLFTVPVWKRTTAFSTFWLQLPLQHEDGVSAQHKLNCRWS